MTEFISVKEAVEISGLSTSTIYRALHKGELPAFKRGKRVLIHREAITKYITSNTWQPQTGFAKS